MSAPNCSLSEDVGCVSVAITPPRANARNLVVQATANVPTTFFRYVFMKEYFQIGVQTEEVLEDAYRENTPLILNQG